MNPRERLLAAVIVGVVVLAGSGFLSNTLFLKPLKDRNITLDQLAKSIEEKEEHIREVVAQRPKLELWQQLSLPADVIPSQREYEKFLTDIMLGSGFRAGSFPITPQAADKGSLTIPGKGPIYTKLPFSVQAHGTLKNLVQMLTRFYKASLLHQIKSLTIARPLVPNPQQQQQQGELEINFKVEALVLAGAEKRKQLLPGVAAPYGLLEVGAILQGAPAGVALVPWAVGPTGPLGPSILAQPSRHYDLIAKKDIFFGEVAAPPAPDKEEVEVGKYVKLVSISRDERLVEAFLFDQYNNRKTRLRAEPGFDTFRIQGKGSERPGKVIRIDDRDVFFRVDDDYFDLHVGQSIEEAMRKQLGGEQMRSLGLVKVSLNAQKGH
jgi:hypothetical protein